MIKATAGHRHADDHYRLVAASELVYGESHDQVVSRRDGASAGSASSTSTRCRCICANRKSPASTSSPTATAGSIRTSAGRAGPAIRRITWRGSTRRIRSWRRWAPAASAFPRGHILHDYLEARVMPRIVGPVGRGEMQYAEIWKAAQRLTPKPVKFGTVTPELVAFAVQDEHYKRHARSRIMAMSDAFNEELHDLADAGCPVIQMEEPQIHLLAARELRGQGDQPRVHAEGVQQHGARGCAPRPRSGATPAGATRRSSGCSPRCRRYKPALELLNQVDADVITFEMASSGAMDLEDVGKAITEKKVVIGAIDHHTLQVESPDEVADAGAAGAEVHSGRAAGAVVGLRHGARGHEPAPRVLQDGGAGAGRRTSCKKELGLPVRRVAGRGSEVLADPNQRRSDRCRQAGWRLVPPHLIHAADWTMINAAIVGLGWWGKTLVEAVQSRQRRHPLRGGRDAHQSRRKCRRSPTRRSFSSPTATRRCSPIRRSTRWCWRRRIRMHAAQVIAAAAARKHVFCEKPFALTKADADAAVAATTQAGVTLGLGYNRRFHPEMTKLRERIRIGRASAPSCTSKRR